MLALRYYGNRDIRLEDIPIPEVKENEVLIKVTDAGLSQTQVNEFIEGPLIINTQPHPLTGKSIPLIPCQEYGGIVEKVGKNVDPLWIGKQVAVLPLVYCGECEYCKKGKQNLCDKRAYHGLLGLDGGFAEYSVVNVNNIFPVDKKELLTFIEPILVGINTLDLYKRHSGLDSVKNLKVLILGAGAVGLSIAAVWKFFAQANVYINEILNFRKQKAGEAGFKIIEKNELRENSFDVVIDAAGMDPLSPQEALKEGLRYVKKGEFFISVGSYFHPISFVPVYITANEKHVLSSMAYKPRQVDLLPHIIEKINIDFSKFITEIPLKNIIEDGYYRAEVEKESFIRIVVKC
ncbi:alcohol dehydrogenase catalytic domain-containing protein [Persephonella sp.]|uniref:alcohol dehydrogenase catalytic domain-containing protein n=1 Tax=Persephonella sp. TaxID=2060922 RepID=UPI00262E6E56|nr:alcohol dehydrogenase catalytic domain-containing protein [Persephonella sp.]